MRKVVCFALAVLMCGCFLGCDRTDAVSGDETLGTTEATSEPGGVQVEEVFYTSVCYVNFHGDEFYTTALNAGKMAISSVMHLPIFKFETLEEFQSFVANNGGQFLMDQRYDEAPSFHDATEHLDDAFFEERALLLVAVNANSGSYRYGVAAVAHEGESLCVHVETLNHPEAVTMDLAGWFVLVEVPKTMIAGCTEFDADLDNVE